VMESWLAGEDRDEEENECSSAIFSATNLSCPLIEHDNPRSEIFISLSKLWKYIIRQCRDKEVKGF
jgi:hypothetical protein